ncbi:MAG: NAD(P)H-dependent oxidoreductase [Desulfobacterota bacterium]|jgi:FMN-dependent NADH-azoreductase|nr:NAD(P)H-dependent oxidoreductase [Thermodesulfobacteriota bacterium]
MSKLLYIQASPRIERSYSIAAAEAFVSAYKQANPKDEVVSMNLFNKDLPAFDGLAVQAKYTILHGLKHTAEELAAWKRVEELIAEFKSADKYALAVPMWNFGIPYRLKQYLDIIVQPGYTFSFSPKEGYKGLVTGKPVFVAYSRGGAYPKGSAEEAFDLQTKYFQLALGFIGFTDIRTLIVEPTLAGPDVTKKIKEDSIAKAKEMARVF